MIHRLRKVTDGLYRGSAPSVKDLIWLHKMLGIKKIVSLDKATGENIDRATKLLGIKHVKAYIDGTRASLLNLLKNDIKDLLISDGPTFVHCHHGKDRTGLVVALFESKYLNKSPEKAITDAKKLGFGFGVPPEIVHLYENIILHSKSQDSNDASIVSNMREPTGDDKDSMLDHVDRQSFAPFMDTTKQFPYDMVYKEIDDQSPTRDNYDSIKQHSLEKEVTPLVGLYNNDAGAQGAGVAISPGGFIYD